MKKCKCNQFQNTGTCSHTREGVPRQYVPLDEQIQRGVGKAVAKHQASNKPQPLTRDQRKERAEDLRHIADSLEQAT